MQEKTPFQFKKFALIGATVLTMTVGAFATLQPHVANGEMLQSMDNSFTITQDNSYASLTTPEAREKLFTQVLKENPGFYMYSSNAEENKEVLAQIAIDRANIVSQEKDKGTFSNTEEYRIMMTNLLANIDLDNQQKRAFEMGIPFKTNEYNDAVRQSDVRYFNINNTLDESISSTITKIEAFESDLAKKSVDKDNVMANINALRKSFENSPDMVVKQKNI